MTALVVLLLVLLLAAGTGRSLLHLLRLTPESRIDRLVYSVALGLGVIAYLVLLLGLLGLLARGPVLAAFLLLAALAGVGVRVFERSGVGQQATPEHRTPNTPSLLSLITGVILTVLGLLTLLNCFVPPGAHEWDALSYHLANPKVFLREGRIVFLPTDHHSNFPFLMQMLFLVGLLFDGYALANLFHFATGALCVATVLSLGRRHFAPSAGLVGALVVATTPLVIWESSTAYVDMAFALYVLLAVAAALEFRQRRDSRWLALSGILMGFALSVKTLALIPFALLALLLLLEHRRVRTVGLYLLCAVVVGCPFYIKTWVLTGNPVYPFAYRIFGGRYWNARLAEIYASEQRGFGINRELIRAEDDLRHVRLPYHPPRPADRLRNLIVAPFYLVAFPRLFYNFNDLGFASQLGFLFLALPPLLFLAGRASAAARWLAALVLLWFAAWSQTMQYVRYLLPLLPLLALLGGEGACRMTTRFPALSALVGAAVAGQLGLTLSFFLPELPRQYARAFNPTVREEYLAVSVNHYGAMQWLNQRTPPDAGVVLFEETRGFHLDRPYLWGNGPHSTYIPYDTFTTGRQMTDWFLQHGYRYAILNLQFAQQSQSSEGYARLKAASQEGTMAKLMLEWYDPKTLRDEHWRWLLADAIWNGGAVYVPEASSRGAVVLEFRPGPGRNARSDAFDAPQPHLSPPRTRGGE